MLRQMFPTPIMGISTSTYRLSLLTFDQICVIFINEFCFKKTKRMKRPNETTPTTCLQHFNSLMKNVKRNP